MGCGGKQTRYCRYQRERGGASGDDVDGIQAKKINAKGPSSIRWEYEWWCSETAIIVVDSTLGSSSSSIIRIGLIKHN